MDYLSFLFYISISVEEFARLSSKIQFEFLFVSTPNNLLQNHFVKVTSLFRISDSQKSL